MENVLEVMENLESCGIPEFCVGGIGLLFWRDSQMAWDLPCLWVVGNLQVMGIPEVVRAGK